MLSAKVAAENASAPENEGSGKRHYGAANDHSSTKIISMPQKGALGVCLVEDKIKFLL